METLYLADIIDPELAKALPRERDTRFDIMTPQTHPNHDVIGQLFAAHHPQGGAGIWYCDSYDPRQGFWMTLVNGLHRTNVSTRAIGATFHTIRFDHYDGITRAFSKYGSPFYVSRPFIKED